MEKKFDLFYDKKVESLEVVMFLYWRNNFYFSTVNKITSSCILIFPE